MTTVIAVGAARIGAVASRTAAGAPGNPFATRSAHVEVLALGDAVRDLGRHHLLGMGYGLIDMGYLGPRHAFWGSVPVDHAALLSCH